MFATSKYTSYTTLSKAREYFCDGDFGYRFHFNGMESDKETYGEGNSYNFGARIYDTRLRRRKIVDPMSNLYPDQSPYAYCINNLVLFVDQSMFKLN